MLKCVVSCGFVESRGGVVKYQLVRSYGSVEERSVHTGKVAGSIPARTTDCAPARCFLAGAFASPRLVEIDEGKCAASALGFGLPLLALWILSPALGYINRKLGCREHCGSSARLLSHERKQPVTFA